MRKVKLAIDSLRVESFATSESGAEHRGTVAGHMSRPTRPLDPTLQAENTCECTMAPSCIQTNCLMECHQLSLDPTCPA